MATRPSNGGGAAALPLDLIAQALPKLSRHELEAVTERLIDWLNTLDPDPELEPEEDRCVAGDDGCAPVILHGRTYWGAYDDAV